MGDESKKSRNRSRHGLNVVHDIDKRRAGRWGNADPSPRKTLGAYTNFYSIHIATQMRLWLTHFGTGVPKCAKCNVLF